jgi:tetratricopeptide (TPR) repeat protein
MSNVAKLKKQAAEFELKKQFDKALAIYVKLLESYDEHANELDVALFNRVGDLQLRQGNVADAVDYYERAVDKYAEGGFFNNAIALCNKILRQSPGRVSVYYKLGKISAQKGFKADAKQNFLEYAERMQKSGKTDEAFRALKEFADLCPDQDDIRLMLADQLTRLGRKDEAVEQLQTLYERYESEGRSGEAAATADRLRALKPDVELRAGSGPRKAAADDLIFIDLGDTPSGARARQSAAAALRRSVPQPRVSSAIPKPPEPDVERTSADETLISDLSTRPTVASALDGITRVDDIALGVNRVETPAGGLLGLESTSFADDTVAPSAGASFGALDLEPTSLTPEASMPVQRSSQQTPAFSDESAGADLELIMPPTEPVMPDPSFAKQTPASPGLLDLEPSEELTALPTVPSSPRTSDRKIEPPTDGLELMDLEVPSAPVPAPTDRRSGSSRAIPRISIDQEALTPPTGSSAVPESETAGRQSLELDADWGDSAATSTPAGMESTGDTPIDLAATPLRPSTLVAAHSVEILGAAVEGDPNDWSLRRELAEAMFDAGDRAGGIGQLELAMAGAEHANDLTLAGSLADELARLEPDAVKHHHKRVEYAFRRNDRPRLVESYLSLGDALLRADQVEKARIIYQRVLDLSPDDARGRAALDSLPVPEAPPPPVEPPRSSVRGATTRASSARAPAPAPPVPVKDVPATEFVNLGDWLREDEGPKDTRMVVEEKEPTGDEDADFADMLAKFKQGVAANVDAEDYQSHYDLAIAYKEMGLLDEAIAGFQRALGSPANRLPTYEALGQCFMEKNQPRMAAGILQRALNEPGVPEAQLVGVLYLLGRASEALGKPDDAVEYYQRVFVIDIQFRDVTERLSAMERAGR